MAESVAYDMMDDEEHDGAEQGVLDPMSDEDFQGAVAAAIVDARNYIDDNIAPYREEAMKYYRGEPFGNEEEGRSQVVMTEVRDTVLAMMPSLLRVFTSSEKPVEFAPRRQEHVAMAEQATCSGRGGANSVSYTHLTLPTNSRV